MVITLHQSSRLVLILMLVLSSGCGRSRLNRVGYGTSPNPTGTVPNLGTVTVESGRGSAVVIVPPVTGAADYRAFVGSPQVAVDLGGNREQVNGSVIYCAGYQQHNAPAEPVEIVRKIQVDDLRGPTEFVVEALDRPCPFPGAFGRTNAVIPYPPEHPDLNGSFSIFTEAEIRARYGSLIINGQGPGSMPGQPGDATAPIVLARTRVTVSPLPAGTPPPTTTFFDDFSADDQPILVANLPEATDGRQGFRGKLFQNANWSFYMYNGEDGAQVFVDRGVLRTVVADWAQGPMSTIVAFPRRPVQLSNTTYLHVTFQTEINPTGRRYWWLSLCGAAQLGRTIDANGRLTIPLDAQGQPTAPFVQTGFFFMPDGKNPSLANWNCLQVFPRSGTRADVPPTYTPVETDVRVMVNRADVNPSVVNVSPGQIPEPYSPPNWWRQQNASGLLATPMLDDQQRLGLRVTVDLYVRRDRVVMYVEGQQRLCNDFGPVALTMAEGALGYGNVLYHSAEERFELQRGGITGQRHYLSNTPFLNTPTWDNMGYDENVSAPPDFDSSACFAYRG